MSRIPKTTKPFTLSDYLTVIREFGFTRYEPRAGVITFDPACGFTLKLTMKVMEFMGEGTVITGWAVTRAGIVQSDGKEPLGLNDYFKATRIPPFTADLESDIARCYSGCMKQLKANSAEHEYAISAIGKTAMVMVVIGQERIDALRDLLLANGQPYPD